MNKKIPRTFVECRRARTVHTFKITHRAIVIIMLCIFYVNLRVSNMVKLALKCKKKISYALW